MANVQHASLTGSSLHENKGVESASDNTIATASSGVTVWQKVSTDSISTALSNAVYRNVLFQGLLENITIAGAAATSSSRVYFKAPFDGTIASVTAYLNAPLSGTGITVIVTLTNVTDGTTVGTITLADTGTYGTATNMGSLSNTTFSAGEVLLATAHVSAGAPASSVVGCSLNITVTPS